SGHRAGTSAEEEQLGPAPRRRISAHRQDDRQRRLRPRLDRNGGYHVAVYDADVSVPPDRLAARARHEHPGVPPGEWTDRVAAQPDTDGGARPGRLLGRPDARIRLRAAMERLVSA